MGTGLAVAFIAATAALGVAVGLRDTHIDGSRIEAELTRDGMVVECDRSIRLGVSGAAFECTYGGHDRVEFTMTRDGKYAPSALPR